MDTIGGAVVVPKSILWGSVPFFPLVLHRSVAQFSDGLSWDFEVCEDRSDLLVAMMLCKDELFTSDASTPLLSLTTTTRLVVRRRRFLLRLSDPPPTPPALLRADPVVGFFAEEEMIVVVVVGFESILFAI